MAVSMVEIVEDLRAETLDLERMLAPLPAAAWETATPAPGWAVRDQVSHLAWFDDAAVQAATAPDDFRAATAGATAEARGVDDIAARYRALSVRELREWFRAARARLLDVCLVVTQRRHLADVALDVTGPVAAEWMPIAQAFAGPPGAGRSPGQFAR